MNENPFKILIIEDNKFDAEIIFDALHSRFKEVDIIPSHGNQLDMDLMYSLIRECNQYAEKSLKSKEKREKQEQLKDYFTKHIAEKNSVDLIILDVALDDKELLHEINGAKIRSILYDLYPKAQVIFCSTLAKKENIHEYMRSGEDNIIFKDDYDTEEFSNHFLGELLGFLREKKILKKNIEEESKQEQETPGAGKTLQERPGSKEPLPMLSYLWKNKKFVKLVLRLADKTISAFVLLVFSVFLLSAAYYIYEFVVVLYQHRTEKEKLISEILHTLELLFILPLPFLIVTSFLIYCKKVSKRHFLKPLGHRSEGIDLDSKFYISLSKSLFVSTLISVLSINLLEKSILILSAKDKSGKPVNTPLQWQDMIVLGITIVLLAFSYILVERSIHHVIKLYESRKEL